MFEKIIERAIEMKAGKQAAPAKAVAAAKKAEGKRQKAAPAKKKPAAKRRTK